MSTLNDKPAAVEETSEGLTVTGLIRARIQTTYPSGSTASGTYLFTQEELIGLMEWVRDNTRGLARSEAEWLRVHGPQPDSHTI